MWPSIKIALQYFTHKPVQSSLAILGVALGVMAYVVLANFMSGVNDFLDRAVFQGNPDITISALPQVESVSKSGTRLGILRIKDWKILEDKLKADKRVKAITPALSLPVILESNFRQIPAIANGVIPDKEKTLYELDKRVKSGLGFEGLKAESSILLGSSLAAKLKLAVGDSLFMLLPNGKKERLALGGIFSFGITTVDNIRSYVNIISLQQHMARRELVTHLNIRLNKKEDLSLAKELKIDHPELEVVDWKEGNQTILVGNRVRDILTYCVSFMLLLVAGFGIYSIQNIMVYQKRKEMAALMTFGYSRMDVKVIFVFQAFFIGLLGSVLGLVAGLLVSLWIDQHPLGANDFIITDNYPINFNILYYIIGFLFGVSCSTLSGLLPAIKATQINIARTIREL